MAQYLIVITTVGMWSGLLVFAGYKQLPNNEFANDDAFIYLSDKQTSIHNNNGNWPYRWTLGVIDLKN